MTRRRPYHGPTRDATAPAQLASWLRMPQRLRAGLPTPFDLAYAPKPEQHAPRRGVQGREENGTYEPGRANYMKPAWLRGTR